jgi:hypothetical protein
LLEETWERFMRCFDWLPLAATIDKSVFCCHAGIPRAIMLPSRTWWGQSGNGCCGLAPTCKHRLRVRCPPGKDKEMGKTILERIKDMQRPLIEEGDIDGAEDVRSSLGSVHRRL